MGEIVAFYSYKGGVGRTMGVANLAVLLAQRGYRVLAVDFDLDAPGLHRYFLRDDTEHGAERRSPPRDQRGVIDMFIAMQERIEKEEAQSIVEPLLDDPTYGYRVRVSDPVTRVPVELSFLPAGLFDDDYARRVQGFPWVPLYEEHGELFDALAAGWRRRYDYVLVDSRTGITDIGSVSTVILADKLVLAFTPNEQSLNGAIEVGRQAVLEKRNMGGSLPIFPLLSRVDEGEEILRRDFFERAGQRFASLFKELYRRLDVDFAAYFADVHIPHKGYYSYWEKVSAEADRSIALGTLASGYRGFLERLLRDRFVAQAVLSVEERLARLPQILDGDLLVAVVVSGIQRFIFDVPTNNGGLEVKGRSFLVALLPKVLAWRARRAAALGDEYEVMVAAGRATLLVPKAAVEAVRSKLLADVRWLRDETGDDLAVDVAVYPVGARESLSDALRTLDGHLGRARWRRADSEGDGFWEPKEPAEDRNVDPEQETPFASLGRKLRGKAPRVTAIAVADAGAEREGDRRWSRVLGLAVAVGESIEDLPEVDGAPRLLLRMDEKEPSPSRLPDETASFPLAGAWIAPDGDGVLDFNGLAGRSEGDAKLGILRLDLDSLGAAFAAVENGKRGDEVLRARLALSNAVKLVCGPVADKVTWDGASPRPVQWILAGGDDLFLVGAWSEILDVSLALRAAIVPRLREMVEALAGKGAADKLDLSGGIVLADPGVPLAHLADQADEEEQRAKGERTTRLEAKVAKGAVSWGGVVMSWGDWELVVELGKRLGDAIANGKVPRGILHRLVHIHTLWHGARRALDMGMPRQAAETSKRQWLWAYELGRARGGLDEREGAALVERLSRLALEDLDTATGKRTERPAAAWLGIVAEIAHRRTRGRGEERA